MPHIHEKIDFTVSVYIVCRNRVLIRKHDKYGFWLAVGGHIELDENPNDSALREVKEEVGLDVVLLEPRKRLTIEKEGYKELTPPWHLNIHRIDDTHQHIDFVFFATSESDEVVPEKSTDEWHWLSMEELEKNDIGIEEQNLFYAKEALKVASGNS